MLPAPSSYPLRQAYSHLPATAQPPHHAPQLGGSPQRVEARAPPLTMASSSPSWAPTPNTPSTSTHPLSCPPAFLTVSVGGWVVSGLTAAQVKQQEAGCLGARHQMLVFSDFKAAVINLICKSQLDFFLLLLFTSHCLCQSPQRPAFFIMCWSCGCPHVGDHLRLETPGTGTPKNCHGALSETGRTKEINAWLSIPYLKFHIKGREKADCCLRGKRKSKQI